MPCLANVHDFKFKKARYIWTFTSICSDSVQFECSFILGRITVGFLFFLATLIFITSLFVVLAFQFGYYTEIFELDDLFVVHDALFEDRFDPGLVSFCFNANAVGMSLFEASFIHVFATIFGKLANTMRNAIFELAFIDASVGVIEFAMAFDVSFVELASVNAFIMNSQRALSLHLTILELASVPIAVWKRVNAVVTLEFVVHPIALVFVAGGKFHDAKALLFAIDELAFESITDGRCLLYFAVELVVDPVPFNDIAIGKGQLALTVLLVIKPIAFEDGVLETVEDTVAVADHLANKPRTIGVNHLVVQAFLRSLDHFLILGAKCWSKCAH